MKTGWLEVILGAATLAGAALFVVYAYSIAGTKSSVDGYEVTARFDRADGIVVGGDVRVSGIRVGSVESLELDAEEFFAVATLRVSGDVRLPLDTSARITSAGLFSDNYISLEPGGDVEDLEEGDEIIFTTGSVDVMGLIQQAVFAFGGSDDEGEGEDEGSR